LTCEGEGKQVKVDQVRALVGFVNQTAQLNGYKVVIIDPADAMNINAANALLKTLEEPSKDTILMLLTDRAMALPATIRSRCQKLHFPVPPLKDALSWLKEQEGARALSEEALLILLKLAGHAPLKVLQLIEADELSMRQEFFNVWNGFLAGQVCVVDVSKAWGKLALERVLTHLRFWVMDLIYVKQGLLGALVNTDFQTDFEKMAAQYDLKALFDFYDALNQAMSVLKSTANPNKELLLEGLLLSFSRQYS